MKCPLRHRAQYYGSLQLPDNNDDCLKEESAWWDDGTPGCAELAKAKSLQKIEGLLFELIDKMPHEGQFRK